MADITNDEGILEEQPSGKTPAENPADPQQKNLDREADKSSKRASETTKRYDKDHGIFTK